MAECDAVSEIAIPIIDAEKKNNKDSTEIKKTTRRLQFQATVKRFQFDLDLNLEGQHMLISSCFQRYVSWRR